MKYKIILNQRLKIRTKRTDKLKTKSSYNTLHEKTPKGTRTKIFFKFSIITTFQKSCGYSTSNGSEMTQFWVLC